jgi:formylmethanofuran dehydrogenase subunit E
MEPNATFARLLQASVEAHGHLCAGQVLGVRMGMLGLNLLGCDAPLDPANIKDVVVVVEIDRCAADALGTTTGVKLGRRSLKFKDFGLMAATFLRLSDGAAYRVYVKEDCRDRARTMLPHVLDDSAREIEAYQRMGADELFGVESVSVNLAPEDLPGWRGEKAICGRCGQVIRHRRELLVEGRTLCPVCAGRGYFESLDRVTDLNALDPALDGGDRGRNPNLKRTN